MKRILFALIAIFTMCINCRAMEKSVTKYYETTYLYDIPITKEITENTYNSSDISLLSNDVAQTEYKKLVLQPLMILPK